MGMSEAEKLAGTLDNIDAYVLSLERLAKSASNVGQEEISMDMKSLANQIKRETDNARDRIVDTLLSTSPNVNE